MKKTISRDQLISILTNVDRATPVTMTCMTDARARKTGNPFESIHKLSTVNGFIGFDYESVVNRQLTREGKDANFVSNSRSWGSHVSKCLVQKGTKLYLAFKPQSSTEPLFYGKKDGKLLRTSRKAIEAFLPAKKEGGSETQGTDTAVQYRNYDVDNIMTLTINKEKFYVRA